MSEKVADIARYLKSKLKKKAKILIMCGELCNRVELGDQKLLDYIIQLAAKTDAPVAATGNTVVELKKRGVKARKMFAAEIVFYLKYNWREELGLPDKPEVVVLVGYNSDILKSIVSTLESAGVDTVVLDNIEIEEATFSMHGLSFQEWKQGLEMLIKSL
ncbi:MAG: hypothetical protein N2V72_02345 [Methanophagales archaeon]|nr:hypothetical protein [Methanophagales archaeon]